ncbi:MAG TPA: hypothetical protein DHV36_01770 [Desulfobacteraceae bacterium]|nr:hypothetical protein [Desulfobacteraceae bacterium]
MALSEFEIKRMEKLVGSFVERRRPEVRLRGQVDLGFRVTGQSFEIYEIRPLWDDPSKIIETSLAKATWVKSRKIWKLFWMRSDLKWHVHTPCPTAASLEEALEVIERDAYGCFFG